jgi:hypothetical protein
VIVHLLLVLVDWSFVHLMLLLVDESCSGECSLAEYVAQEMREWSESSTFAERLLIILNMMKYDCIYNTLLICSCGYRGILFLTSIYSNGTFSDLCVGILVWGSIIDIFRDRLLVRRHHHDCRERAGIYTCILLRLTRTLEYDPLECADYSPKQGT